MSKGVLNSLRLYPQEQILRVNQLRFWCNLRKSSVKLRFQHLRFIGRSIGVPDPNKKDAGPDRLDVLHSHRVCKVTIEHDQAILCPLAHITHGPSLRHSRSSRAQT
ncbi:hypothetical protein GCM10010384_17690 [Streptomyces djakartensis]|uniref:Transposase n=1 Tax=Streptomyces djakartensis TaxID=68193 RepID=A0ABQ2ZGU7_9ACTN|nr:hypothetical protein GCM10010384_17690 [Streptomyces djakartensis]